MKKLETKTMDCQKNPYVSPRVKVVEITNSNITCTSEYGTQAYDADEYNPWQS